ncbi:MAG: A/G-specific adenine glycosylase [Nitrospiria bacterium]
MKTDLKFSNRLLKWYKQNGRDLPWRTTFTPYSVWVSEIMLQQTQVDTVIPYFHRFLDCFPTIDSLANASLDQVLKQWEGLGYYSRARNLHQAARIINDRLNGEFPHQFDQILDLPGIGRSTAGAILSLAYNLPYPIMDGNVRRVLSRYFALQSPPGKRLEDLLWKYSNAVVPKKEARSFNSALMDLGATLCKPKDPQCQICPLKSSCLGFQKNLQKILPMKKKREKIPLRINSAMVIWKKDRVLIQKREEKGLLGGLWEFPGMNNLQDFPRINGELMDWHPHLGFRLTDQEFLFKLKHTFTHFKMDLYVFKARFLSGKGIQKKDQRWVTLDEIENLPFPAADKKIIDVLKMA